MKEIYIDVSDVFQDERIDKVITNACENMSRTYIQKCIKEGSCLVNDKIVKANYRVSVGDQIHMQVKEAVIPDIIPENLPVEIIYEDDQILIVNKPKDMVVHPACGHYSGTLVNFVMYHCKDSLSGINGILRPGIVHRIDKDTTGSLIICKTDFAHNFIARQLKIHSITRKYRAIVHGVIKENEGTIQSPIGRDEKDRLKMAVNTKNGKEAITHYKVLTRFKDYTYVECELETGRTHQIRVHMASINHPLLGDSVYGPSKEKMKLQGQTLHAYMIGFIHPITEKYVEFCAPLPEYFEKLLHSLKQ